MSDGTALSGNRATCLFIVLFAAAGSAGAQSILQFDRWMQRIERRSQSVQRHLTAKDTQSAVTDAQEIGELYKLMEGYFAQRGNASDAVQISRDGEVLAESIVRSAQAADFDTALRSAISIARACRDCHFEFKPLDP